MKRGILSIAVLLVTVIGMAQFTDDFSDGDLSNAPAWSGDAVNFEVLAGELHLNAPMVEDTSILVTPSEAIDNAVWEFTVRMDFNPSSGNRSLVYLTSSSADLQGDLEGYYILIGNTDDEVSLYRQDQDGSRTKIIDGTDDVVNSDPANVRVRVTRDDIGNWTLEHDADITGTYTSDGSVFDSTYESSQFFGLFCDYTSTRSDLFFFDDFVVTGDGFVDTEAPSIVALDVISENELDVQFSETLDQASAEAVSNYFWLQEGTPMSANLDADAVTVHLTFSADFPINVEQSLQISGTSDVAGNPVETVTQPFTYTLVGTASEGDIIINEFMSDPDDVGSVKLAEYVELHNTSTEFLSLNGWVLMDGTTARSIPDYVIAPGAFVLLTDDDTVSELLDFGDVLSLPALGLTNSGEYMGLRNNEGETMDEINWNLDWYKGTDPDGVSLERVNPSLQCSSENNWKPNTEEDGGSPGEANSVLDLSPDELTPEITEVVLTDDNVIEIYFSEPLDDLSIITGNYLVDNEASQELAVEVIENINSRIIRLTMNGDLIDGVLYWVTITGITDCEGNGVGDGLIGYFALPQVAEEGDLVLNEILFNEREDAVDYVEIYNNSDKYISLEGWLISRREFDGDEDDYEISSRYRLLRPGHFALLSENSFIVKAEYPQGVEANFIQLDGFPAFPNSDGTVLLKGPSEEVLDEFYYSEEYHFVLLDDVDGVSLERLDYNRLTNDPTNWHSAAEAVNWGTPGYENSQFSTALIPESSFLISPEVFSPDNDGFDDVANISYTLDGPGNVANVSIFDKRGRLMRQLLRNELLGTTGTFSWDGSRDDRSKASIGVYIVYIEVFDVDGNITSLKKTVVLGGRLSN